jgi:hypothetical protein
MVEPSLTVLVILELIGLFVAVPLTDIGRWPWQADFLIGLSILFAAVLVVLRNRAAVVTVLVAFIVGVLTPILRQDLPSELTIYLDFAAKIVFLGALTWIVGVGVFSPGRITFHRIQGAIAIYLQIAILFTFIYLLIIQLVPGAFVPAIILHGPTGDIMKGARGGSQLVYFSFVTLTSVGYGDIVPLHPLARSFANMEAIIGQLFPATILARVVTLELQGRQK